MLDPRSKLRPKYSSNVRLTVAFNTIPEVADLAATPAGPCGPEPLLVNAAPEVSALLNDGDGDNLSRQVAFWPWRIRPLESRCCRARTSPKVMWIGRPRPPANVDQVSGGDSYAWQARVIHG